MKVAKTLTLANRLQRPHRQEPAHTITGDAHAICVEGPEEVLMPLLNDGILQLYAYEEEWAEDEAIQA
jgi:hypothetical protein